MGIVSVGSHQQQQKKKKKKKKSTGVGNPSICLPALPERLYSQSMSPNRNFECDVQYLPLSIQLFTPEKDRATNRGPEKAAKVGNVE